MAKARRSYRGTIETLTASQLADRIAKGEFRGGIILPASEIIEKTIRTIVALGYATEAEIRAEIAEWGSRP
jgi:hypothetical protein